MTWTTANEMAGEDRNFQKSFRQALRDENLGWHEHQARWKVVFGSKEHKDMQRVLEELRRRLRSS